MSLIAGTRLTALLALAALAVCAGCASTPKTAPTTGPSTTTTAPGAVAWGAPVHLSAEQLSAVACAGPSFCVAVDAADDAYRFDGSTWSSPTPLGGQPGLGATPALSCPSASFCVAVVAGTGSVVSWNGATWSAPVAVAGTTLQGVSCVGSHFCATVDGVGDAYLFDGSGWSGAMNDWGGISAISCASPSLCMSVAGGISRFDGSSWTEPQGYGASSNFTGVSCPSTSFCVAVTALGQALQYDGSSWSAPVQIEPAAPGAAGATPAGVSCSTASDCVVVDSAGDALTFDGTWSAPKAIDPSRSLSAVSCAGGLCMAVDDAGNAVAGRT